MTYDPVARVVSLSNPSTKPTWLTPGATYTLSIGVAAAGDYTGGTGPRAIDSATLTAPVVETFQAVTPATPTPGADRAVDFCDDVLPIFQLRCSAGECHGAPLGDRRARRGAPPRDVARGREHGDRPGLAGVEYRASRRGAAGAGGAVRR